MKLRLFLLLWVLALSGCERLGIEPTSAVQSRREAEGKAIGAACRHAGRAIEDCFVLNRKADKSAIFLGWRDMNDYMRENGLDVVKPQLASGSLPAASAPAVAMPMAEAKPLVAKVRRTEF